MSNPESPGARTPDDSDRFAATDEAALVSRLRASYASLPAPTAAQIAHCTTAVLAGATAGPSRPSGWSPHPRWWWAAAAALVVSVGTATVWRRGTISPTSGVRQPIGATSAHGDATRFDLTLPGAAREVALVGDFNGWDEHATPMKRRSRDGAWSAQIALAPGRHVYAFVIDGTRWLVDPLAPQVPDEGFGPANAVVVDGQE